MGIVQHQFLMTDFYELTCTMFVAGSMVSFAMRLLHADLPHLNGRSQETLDRLYYILAVVRKVTIIGNYF